MAATRLACTSASASGATSRGRAEASIHGEEGVARAGCIKRLGGHGGAKLALALLDQPGTCGPWVITKFSPCMAGAARPQIH